MELNEIKSVLEKQGGELKAAIEKYEGQLSTTGVVASEAKDAVRVLGERFEKAMDEIGQKMTVAQAGREAAATPGQALTKSDAFAALVKGDVQKARIEVKNTIVNAAGTTSYPDNQPGVVPGQFKPLTIRDILPAGATNAIMVVGTREASYTSAAAETAQGGAKPESAVTFEQFNVPIETIATWLKVSNQLLADAPSVVSYIDTRLRYALDERVDLQLLKGNGTSPNIGGLLKSGNFTAYTPVVGANLFDSINRAKYQLWALGYAPDAVIVNPADWAAAETLREGAGSGMYLYGAPGTVAGASPFGVPVVMSNNMTAGQFAIGQFRRAAMVWDRQAMAVEMGYVNDDFTKNLVTMRAEVRLGLEVSTPAAILSGAITGVAQG